MCEPSTDRQRVSGQDSYILWPLQSLNRPDILPNCTNLSNLQCCESLLFLPASLTRLSPGCAGKLEIPQEALYKKNVLLHNDMLMGAASQFFCLDPNGPTASQDGDAYNECVYRDDTLVLLELTTRDMMEVLTPAFLTL